MAELLANDEEMKNLGIYICPVNSNYIDMCDRVSALFLNEGFDNFDINDEEIEAAQCEDTNPELYNISRIVGELLEDLELPPDSVDQMMALFLALTPEKIENIRRMILLRENPIADPQEWIIVNKIFV